MITLTVAEGIAQRICDALAPYCDRIDIAGSIRRRKPYVSDIDIVCLPHDPESAWKRCLENATPTLQGPTQMRIRLRNKVEVDICFALPAEEDLFGRQGSNYGSLLICRTGSREHNVYLVELAKSKGFKWKPSKGLYDGDELLASDNEEEIFFALGMPWISPERRER